MVNGYTYLGKIGDMYFWVVRKFVYGKRGRGKPIYLGEVGKLIAKAIRDGVVNAARELRQLVRQMVRVIHLVELLDALIALAKLGVEYLYVVYGECKRGSVYCSDMVDTVKSVVEKAGYSLNLSIEEMYRRGLDFEDLAEYASRWVRYATDVLRRLEKKVEEVEKARPEAVEKAWKLVDRRLMGLGLLVK